MALSNSDLAVSLDIKTRRGDYFSRTFSFTNEDETPKDLTGYSFSMQVRPNETSTTKILSFDMSNGMSVVENDLIIEKTAVEMQVQPGKHYYDLQVTKPGGEVSTWFAGYFTITNDRTK